MNKQELIEKYEKLEGVCKDPGAEIARLIFLEDLRELDEPQKVTVPQLVADWYEECKDDFEISLFQCIYELSEKRNDNELTKFEEWIIECETEPFQTLVNMHQFGYEVEKKKRYIVKIKGLDSNYSILKYQPFNNSWFMGSEQEYEFFKFKHTHKELEEAGFGEVFNSPLFEVEEVEG